MLKYKKYIFLSVLVIFIAILIFLNQDKSDLEENIIIEPIVTEPIIEENEIENIIIHIAGEIKNPGIIELENGKRISDAIAKAGGLTEKANLEDVNLAYCLQDGQKLYIPSIEDKKETYIIENNGEGIVVDSTIKNSIVNINKATVSELESIPGIGPSMAQKIIDHRNEIGKFKNVEDLKNVSGIGEKKYEGIKEYVTVK